VKAEINPTDWITAELVKTVENTYRDVQIAFANEIAMLCEQLGADVWRVRELVNKTPHRDIHFPGAGVGGHCIPKDPWLLASSVADNQFLKLIPTAATSMMHAGSYGSLARAGVGENGK
jgi:UDP-N-acetyl-D-mannosaminuronic acid dehydrogenase